MRFRAQIEYDGAEYFGFQRQKRSQPTIQSELERVLSHLADKPTIVTGAGRTDRGVHASGQVISFDLAWGHGTKALQRAINANLGPDIAVVGLAETAPQFHPRFDARRRAYRYYIYNAPVHSPVRRQRSWHVRERLDVNAMSEAASELVGEQDFATFGSPPQGDNSVREVFAAQWRRHNGLLVFYIEANAFLYRMVRTIVGTLKAVGEGSWTVEAFVVALHARDRSRAAAVAPPHGLYLVKVEYDDEMGGR